MYNWQKPQNGPRSGLDYIALLGMYNFASRENLASHTEHFSYTVRSAKRGFNLTFPHRKILYIPQSHVLLWPVSLNRAKFVLQTKIQDSGHRLSNPQPNQPCPVYILPTYKQWRWLLWNLIWLTVKSQVLTRITNFKKSTFCQKVTVHKDRKSPS